MELRQIPPKEAAELHRKLFGDKATEPVAAPPRNPSNHHHSEDEQLERMFASEHGAKIRRLWHGDMSDYPKGDGNGYDHSAADQGLCNYLVWWFGRDAQRVDRLFRASALMREKWNRLDYRDRTINKAIADTPNVYEWERPPNGKALNSDNTIGPSAASATTATPQAPSDALQQAETPPDVVKTPTPFVLSTAPDGWNALILPSRRFALGYAFPLGCTTILMAGGGAGKSMLLLMAFASICIGRTLVPGWIAQAARPVLYVALEDDLPEILRRLQRIAYVFKFTEWECALVSKNLRFLTLQGVDFFRRGIGNSVQDGPDCLRLAETLRKEEEAFTAIGFDPKSALLAGALDETDNPTAQKVVNRLTALGGPDTAVILTDHVAKAERATAQSARGGGAWEDAARQSWGMRPLTDSEKKEAGSSFEPWLLVALELRKSNYTGPQPTQYFLRCTHPEGVGVLDTINFDEAKQNTAARKEDRLKTAILTVLETQRFTAGELTGKYGTHERQSEGGEVRAEISRLAGQEISCRKLHDALERMLETDLLIKKKDEETKRNLLVPVNKLHETGQTGHDRTGRHETHTGRQDTHPVRGVSCPVTQVEPDLSCPVAVESEEDD